MTWLSYAGLFMGGGGSLLGNAIVLILAVTAWVLGHMFPFFYVMKVLGLLRVDEAEERMGLDISHHGGSAYEATQGADLLKGKGDESDQALLTRCVWPPLLACWAQCLFVCAAGSVTGSTASLHILPAHYAGACQCFSREPHLRPVRSGVSVWAGKHA